MYGSMLVGTIGVGVIVGVDVMVTVAVWVFVAVAVNEAVRVSVTVGVAVLVRQRFEPPARESQDELTTKVHPLLHVDGPTGCPQEFVPAHSQH